MNRRCSHFFFLNALTLLCVCASLMAQTPKARILTPIDDAERVTLGGNVHPMVAAAKSLQAVDESTPMEHMVLLLKGDATQEAQLAQMIARQNDPKSPLFHHYLTPEEFGAQYGVADADIAKVTNWLESQGFKIDELPAGKRAVVFSGTAGQAAAAFKTEIKQLTVGGESHLANATEPTIPAALATTVGGVVKLHDFRHTAHVSKKTVLSATGKGANPLFTYGSAHYLAPADYSTIYDIGPLYSANINGTGQTIAIIARSNIKMSDVTTFRSQFGLKANDPQIVITNTDPGIVSGDTVETTLDTEWSGAVAPGATVKVIVANSTNSADGIDLSALYAVNNNVAPIVSLSYGSCEAGMGSAELSFYNSLWEQAAAQGQSVMVSSGDSGAAGCQGGSSSTGSGQGINGLCSSPYATCVGGTEFAEGSNPGQYWLPGNNALMGSATGYIPETVWNESGSNSGSGLWGGGGGVSIYFAKPTWQAGPGVPADGHRDVPDVSLSASGHDGYLITLDGALNAVGGTSAAAPSFAGMMALVDQKANARQGLANAILYPLATNQASGGAAVFHDITTGNNTVPGVKGFSATAGYDMGSGLGSVDANLLVNHWTDGSNVAALTLTAPSTPLTLPIGQSTNVTITAVASAALKSAVALTVSGAPSGVTATLTPTTIAAPGSGTTVLKLTAATTAAAGTYSLTVTGVGGTQTAHVVLSMTVVVPTFTLSASATSVTAIPGGTTPVTLTMTPQNGFSSAVALSATGLPTGVTVGFAPATISGTATAAGGNSVVTFTVAKTTKTGSYPVTISATGGGVTKTATVTLVVGVTPSCTLSVNPTSLSISAGQQAGVQVACSAAQGTFGEPLKLSVTGVPSGVTAQFAVGTLVPGSIGALTLFSTATTTAGKYGLSVTASGSGFTQSVTLPVTIATPSTFTLSADPRALAIALGGTGQTTIRTGHVGSFNSAIGFKVLGLPTGVTSSFSNTMIAAPGDGAVTATFSVAANAPQGVFTFAIVGTGGGVTQSIPMTVTIGSTKQDFSFAVSVTSLTAQQGVASSPFVVSVGNFTGGFNSTIMLTFSGVPAGMAYRNTSATTGNNLINLSFTMTASTATPAGVYPVTITATSGSIVHSAVVQVTVTKAGQAAKPSLTTTIFK